MILAAARLGVAVSEEDKQYTETRFSAEILKEAIAGARAVAARGKTDLSSQQLRVEHDDSEWTYDTVEEFLADFRKYRGYAYCSIYGGNFDLSVTFTRRDCTVSMKASSRSDIETVFDIFEKHANEAKLPPRPAPAPERVMPVVFMGHGRSDSWRDLKDHLQDKHGFKIEAYESGARAGHTRFTQRRSFSDSIAPQAEQRLTTVGLGSSS